ncbi:MAG: hypothetical protein ABNH02_01940 [Pseudomonadales bacterium]|jgi:uncharacterized protein YdeI (BOF family)
MKKSSIVLLAALVSGGAFADVQTVELAPVAPQVAMGASSGTAIAVSATVGVVAVGTAVSIASDDSTTPDDGEEVDPPVTTTTTTNT